MDAALIDCLAKGLELFSFSDATVPLQSGFPAPQPTIECPTHRPSHLHKSVALLASLLGRVAGRILNLVGDHLALLESLCPNSVATGEMIVEAQDLAITARYGHAMDSAESALASCQRFAGSIRRVPLSASVLYRHRCFLYLAFWLSKLRGAASPGKCSSFTIFRALLFFS